jgi:Zn-dependent protease with chaperone function
VSAPLSAILQHLRDAPRPPAPPAPTGQVVRLSITVSFFRAAIAVLLPLVCLTIFFAPLIVYLVTGSRMLRGLRDVFGFAGIWIIVAWWRAFFAKDSESAPTVRFDRRVDRRLFDLVDEVADAAGAPPIDEIWMSPGAGFAVHEERVGRFSRQCKVVLHIDPCDFGHLNLAELASILAHELAHISKGHTAHGLRLYRNTRFLEELHTELARSTWRVANPVYWALCVFRSRSEKLTAAISQQHELQADAIAIGLLGGDTFKSAYTKTLRSGALEELLLPRALHRAIEAKSESNLLADVDAIELSAEERAALNESLASDFAEPTDPLSTHPSHQDRLALATRLAQAQPAELAALSGAEDARDVLFEGRRKDIELAVSRALIQGQAGWLSSAVGLRGGSVAGGSTLPTLTVRKFRTPAYILWLVSALLLVLVFGVGTLVVWADDEAAEGMLRTLITLDAIAFVVLLVAIRARFLGLRAASSELEIHGLLGTRKVQWSDVTALRLDESHLQVRSSTGGRMKVRAEKEDRLQLADMILELSPALAWAAWGTGLARVEQPSALAELPHRVRELSDDLHIEGPGATHIIIEEEHPLHATIREHLERRLLPAMLVYEDEA